MRCLVAVAAVVTLLVPGLAHAQPARTAPVVELAAEPYSESTALALSLGVTAAGVGAMVMGGNEGNDAVAQIGALATFLSLIHISEPTRPY